MFQLVSTPGIKELFPNVDILFRIYLTLPVTNCSGERSFSALQLVKSAIRSSMDDCRLNNLAILFIESDLTRDLDFKDVVSAFAMKKSRKVKF